MNKLQKLATELSLMNLMIGGPNNDLPYGLESFESKSWGKEHKTFNHGPWKPIKQSKPKNHKHKKSIVLKNRISKRGK